MIGIIKKAVENLTAEKAVFKVSGRMSVKTLKKQFKDAFGSTLRIYNGVKFANDDATLASIRKSDTKSGEFEVRGNMLVGDFEKKMMQAFGIKVQVASPDNSELVDNNISLSKSGRR